MNLESIRELQQTQILELQTKIKIIEGIPEKSQNELQKL